MIFQAANLVSKESMGSNPLGTEPTLMSSENSSGKSVGRATRINEDLEESPSLRQRLSAPGIFAPRMASINRSAKLPVDLKNLASIESMT